MVASRLEQSVAHIQNTSTREQRTGFRRERKAAKTIAVILGVAIVCWVPLLVVPRVIASYVHNTTYFTIFTLLQILSVCNSSINPYIYCVRSRRYYEAFVKLLGLHNLVKEGTSHCCSNLHTTWWSVKNTWCYRYCPTWNTWHRSLMNLKTEKKKDLYSRGSIR